MKTTLNDLIEKEITINMGTLEAYGTYVDKIYIKELGICIRLIVSKEVVSQTKGVTISSLNNKFI